MVKNHYRWDFIGLSTDTKPTAETSENVTDGSTFYESNTSKLYVYCRGNWYEKTAEGGGGTSDFDELTNRPKYNGTAMTSETDIPLAPTISQTTGDSQTDVMSQNATTSMLYRDPTVKTKIQIGSNSTSSGDASIAIGQNTTINTGRNRSIAIGHGASILGGTGGIALGSGSEVRKSGEVNIGTSNSQYGYNSTYYRLISGVHDGESDHDCATVGQIKMGVLDSAPTTATPGMPGRLYTHENSGTYDVYLCVHDNGDNTYVWKQLTLV